MAVRTQNTRQCRHCKAPVAQTATACDFCGAYLTEVATGGSRREAIVLGVAGVLTLVTFGAILVPLGRVERETRRARQAAWALEHPAASPEPAESPEPEPIVASPTPTPTSAPAVAPTPGRLLGPGVNRVVEPDARPLMTDFAPPTSHTTVAPTAPDTFAAVGTPTVTSPSVTSPEPTSPAVPSPTPVTPSPAPVATPAPTPDPAPIATPSPAAPVSIAELGTDARVWDGHQWQRTAPGHHHSALCEHYYQDGHWQLFAVAPRAYDGELQDFNLKRPDQGLYEFHGQIYWLRDHVHDASCVHRYGVNGWFLPEAR